MEDNAPTNYYNTQPYVVDAPQYEAPRSKKRNALFYATVAVLITGILVAGGWIASMTILKDSGIAACEAMAKRAASGESTNKGDGKMSQKEYDELRELFSDSRHADIRDPGVRLVDSMWSLQNASKDDQLGMALFTASSIMADLRGLQTGCKNHGIQVDLMQD